MMIHQFWKDAEKFVELDEKQAHSEALWLRQLLTELLSKVDGPVKSRFTCWVLAVMMVDVYRERPLDRRFI